MKFSLIVLDSLGVGALPDSENYGDVGVNTLGHILDRCGTLNIPNLRKLGFGNIEGAADGRLKVDNPIGAFGRAKEISKGKDTITGHWEIAGIFTEIPFPSYPDGFPKEFMDKFHEAIGRETLGNYPASGTEIIEELGDEHEKTGKPIVYTSSDSVFQIAANTDVIPLDKLYEMCQIARDMLQGEWACGRVIARPYIIENGKRKRTSDRHDYAVSPTDVTVLDTIKAAGKEVYCVGKINDIFNGVGVTKFVKTKNNMDGVDKTVEAMKMDFDGFIFTNLVEFDSEYGHRRNAEGYGKAIEEFDARLPELMDAMADDDVMILCADHGNDPTYEGSDHTREYIPIVVYGKKIKAGTNIGTRDTFADIGATIADALGAEGTKIGSSFLAEIK
ncbi:MAG: phosphopentomutase [Clostridia bacterium]|nr:phosphopentomutase [Clostridia bacterium]